MASIPSRAVSVFRGAFLGAVMGAMVKGVFIGIAQIDAGWGWLSIPVGMISGPFLLLVDLLAITAPAGAIKIIVLPWGVAGALVGALGGYQIWRPE